MAYEENIRIIAEELERLKNKVTGDTLPEVETTDEGKVLTVNSSGEWAAADPSSSYDLDYSTTEKNTGKKWIDGKDIYSKVITGTFPVISGTSPQEVGGIDCDDVINITSLLETDDYKYVNCFQAYRVKASGKIFLNDVIASCSEKPYNIIVEYTKPTPVPSNETTSKKKGAK